MAAILSEQILAILLTHINGLVQERRYSIANALELRLSCTNPSIYVSLNLNESNHDA